MSYEVFARKYRPKTFEQVVGQKPVVQTLRNAIEAGRVGQAYIFAGMRGTGKTTVARILAKALNCQHGPTPTPCNECEFCKEIDDDRSVDVLEIDGASSRSVEDIGPVRDTAKYKPIHSRYKIIYIDEVHMLTTHAFNALLKTLEEPPPRTVFIFATTEFHRVPPTIVSRCQHFEFKKISQREIINSLVRIAGEEKITISPSGLDSIARAAEGSLRDAQSLLDQAVAFSGENVRDEDLKVILGAISRELLFECSSLVLSQAPAGVFRLVEKVMEKGHDLRVFYKELIQHFRNLMLVMSVAEAEDLLPLNAEEIKRLREEVASSSLEDILRYLQALQQAEPGLRFSSQPQVYLETLLVKLCHFQKIVPLKQLLAEVQEPGPDSQGLPSPAGGQKPRPFAPVPSPRPVKKPETASWPQPAPLPDGPPAEENKDLFRKLLDELQKERSSLAAILSRQASFRVKDEPLDIKFSPEKRFTIDQPLVLEISFPRDDAYYREAVQRDIRTVERVASEVFGRKVKVRLGEDAAAPGRRREKETDIALKDPSVQAFVDTFRATILSVEPAKGAKERE
jgi:DNA polymerase-3 subunit gamma/tau